MNIEDLREDPLFLESWHRNGRIIERYAISEADRERFGLCESELFDFDTGQQIDNDE